MGRALLAQAYYKSNRAAVEVLHSAAARHIPSTKKEEHMKFRSFAAAVLASALTFTTAVVIDEEPPPVSAATETIHFATAGDSITINNTVENPMWWRQWDSSTILKTSPGGFAKSGYTSAQVLAEIPADIPGADVLVIALGTNDQRLEVPNSTTFANFVKIADKVGAPRVVVTAIPPSNIFDQCGDRGCRTEQYVFNRDLSTFAYQQGWHFIDPWFKVRLLNNGWSEPSATYDGRHPSKQSSLIAKHRIEQAIRIAYQGTI